MNHIRRFGGCFQVNKLIDIENGFSRAENG